MGVYDEFIHLLRKVSPSQAEKLPRDEKAILTSRNIENVVREIRAHLKKNHSLVKTC